MKVPVFDLEGERVDELELPAFFEEPVRKDLIRRVVLAFQANRRQPYGTDPRAGMRTSAESWGAGHGVAMVPRIKGSRHPAAGRGARVAQTVGGRKAHPPKPEKDWSQRVNRRERRAALRSALAATAKPEFVEARGHIIDEVPELPLVVVDELRGLRRAREVREFFQNLGLWADVERAKRKRRIRAGKGKRRGRRYVKPKSVLIVVDEFEGIELGARNHPGVDVVRAMELNVEHLAPGTHPGRLTVYTPSAIEILEERLGE